KGVRGSTYTSEEETMDKDFECYKRYLDGDESGIDELLLRYGAKLISFIYRFTNDEELAEELMEDTFCDVIIKGVGFLGNASFKTYLFSVAKNKAFAEMRRRGKNCDIAAAESYGERYVEASFADSERSRIIARALGRLNRDHRTVIYLLYFENMSYKEIGRVMKKTEKQVNNLAYRAKRALREIFEKDGLTYEELI
ncbi:MAG: RNA polymerase sigma factor, partial [Clostridia bacterium]|nr:RNA polymerase sigma factor [Clostridia bacterium]